MKKTNKGFTLIELLVVISIIGILSSFAMVSLNSARTKSRDALRKGDMTQMRTALNLYYSDNTVYPICDGGNWDVSDAHFGSSAANGTICYLGLDAFLVSGPRMLLAKLPEDPMNTTNDAAATGGSDELLYRYISNVDGTEFALIYYLEEDQTTPVVIRGF